MNVVDDDGSKTLPMSYFLPRGLKQVEEEGKGQEHPFQEKEKDGVEERVKERVKVRRNF